MPRGPAGVGWGPPGGRGKGGGRDAEAGGARSELGTRRAWGKGFPQTPSVDPGEETTPAPQHPLRHPRKFQVTMSWSLATDRPLRGTEQPRAWHAHTHGLWQGGPVTLPTGSNQGVPRAEGGAGQGQGAACTDDTQWDLSVQGQNSRQSAWRSGVWPGPSQVTDGAVVPSRAPGASKRGSCKQGQEVVPRGLLLYGRRLKASFRPACVLSQPPAAGADAGDRVGGQRGHTPPASFSTGPGRRASVTRGLARRPDAERHLPRGPAWCPGFADPTGSCGVQTPAQSKAAGGSSLSSWSCPSLRRGRHRGVSCGPGRCAICGWCFSKTVFFP